MSVQYGTYLRTILLIKVNGERDLTRGVGGILWLEVTLLALWSMPNTPRRTPPGTGEG